ncbi:MAG TPA: hypothetical protein P5306_03255, partial [Kiritimatiellia bacterium]|nr:hypothetical protein [Kiritimatiellia bacterium]
THRDLLPVRRNRQLALAHLVILSRGWFFPHRGNFFSIAWKIPGKFFHAMENPGLFFHTVENPAEAGEAFFHAVENCGERFPYPGKKVKTNRRA